jgi:hypothetical protein
MCLPLPSFLLPLAVPAGTSQLRIATVQKQGDIVLMTLAGQLSSAAQLLQVRSGSAGPNCTVTHTCIPGHEGRVIDCLST